MKRSAGGVKLSWSSMADATKRSLTRTLETHCGQCGLISGSRLSSTRKAWRHCRYAVGRIRYADGSDGRILYLKPMLVGNELPDVTSYQVSHPSFPHESTDNQWFAEAQTESYRMMGLHTVRDVLGNWEGETLEDALEYLEQRGK